MKIVKKKTRLLQKEFSQDLYRFTLECIFVDVHFQWACDFYTTPWVCKLVVYGRLYICNKQLQILSDEISSLMTQNVLLNCHVMVH